MSENSILGRPFAHVVKRAVSFFVGDAGGYTSKSPKAGWVTSEARYPQTKHPVPEFPKMHAVDFDTTHEILLLGTPGGNLQKIADWLSEQQITFSWVARFPAAREMLEQKERFSHAVIDLDYLGGIFRQFDTLQKLRMELSDMPVLLVSEEFSTDNFEVDRIWLCDVSIRPTVSFANLELAFSMAEVNNEIWRERIGRGFARAI